VRNIDKIFCINLDSRTDRWQESIEEFKKLEIEDEVERISAANIQPGIIGCTKSHYECIKLAKERDYKNILVLEDDISFTSEALNVLNNAFDQLDKHALQFEMLYLGANLRGEDNRLIDSNLALISAAKTTHAYIINSSVYDIVLDTYANCQWNDGIDWHYSNPDRLNIDIFYMRMIQSRGNTYGVYPSVAEQRSSYSDLMYSNYYYNLIDTYNKILNNTKF
jgi:glycosyl transferase family 25